MRPVIEPERPGPRGSVGDLSTEDGERLSALQHELHPSIERVRTWGDANPDLFAGVWLDNDPYLQGTGPVRIVVAIAQRDPQAVASEIKALVVDVDRLEIVQRSHAEAMLRAAQHRFTERFMPAGEIRVTGCGVDTIANTFRVMLRAPDAALEDEIRADNVGVPIDFEYGYASWR